MTVSPARSCTPCCRYPGCSLNRNKTSAGVLVCLHAKTVCMLLDAYVPPVRPKL